MPTVTKEPVKPSNHVRQSFTEAASAEKQFWTLIHTKGPLNTDVQELYRKTRSSYEKLTLHADHELAELRDFEHALWRLHYKHIDEYRSMIEFAGRCLDSKEPQDTTVSSCESVIFRKGFIQFLSEAKEFYHSLITKIQESYGLAKDISEDFTFSSECNRPKKFQKGKFLCYRCSVCLGDLSRYNELYASSEMLDHDWLVVASYYLNASTIWPDSGNPHNQLAVLAMYIGDELLALYHCIRSLAVKEPFFNAQDNLTLLFEKNRSSHLKSLSSEVTFSFSKPSKRTEKGAISSDCLLNCNIPSSDKSCLWGLVVRMISFFYVKSSVDEFTCTFASTMRELEILLSLDDAKLKAQLETYQHMRDDKTIAGPLRFLQIVCILIFYIHFLSGNQNLMVKKFEATESMSLDLALAATFICLGRLVHRCLGTNPAFYSLLLPAIMVFAEWLIVRSDIAVVDVPDEKYNHAVDYFISTFVDLVKKFIGMEEVRSLLVVVNESADHSALWEDCELQGFTPVAHVYEQMNSSSGKTRKDPEERDNNCIRIHRILIAAIKLASMSNKRQKWIYYDGQERMFHLKDTEKIRSDVSEKNMGRGLEEILVNGADKASVLGTISETEEPSHDDDDEVIIFKPITRHDSSSIYATIDAIHGIATDGKHKQSASGDFVPHGPSLMAGKPHILNDNLPSSSSETISVKVSPSKDSAVTPTSDSGIQFYLSRQNTQGFGFGIPEEGSCVSTGTPFSTWGCKREHSGVEESQGLKDSTKSSDSGIDDISSSIIRRLAIDEATETKKANNMSHSLVTPQYEYNPLSKGDLTGTGPHHTSTATYCVTPPYHVSPTPSAPLLPEDDDILYHGNTDFTRHDTQTHLQHNPTPTGQYGLEDWKEPQSFVGASSRADDYLRWIQTQGPLIYNPPNLGYNRYNALTPSGFEIDTWPYRHWNYLHQDQGQGLGGRDRYYAPTSFGRFQDPDTSRLATYDQWGQPIHLVYGANDERRERFYNGNNQRPAPQYEHGGVSEQQILLQYLKEREWSLQKQLSQVPH